jgi:heat shock protein HslJ/uncharacterized protein YraI
MDQAGLNDIDVSAPGNYTLLLNPDGSMNIQADCNMVLGSYSVDSSSLSLMPGPSTMAFCGEDSLDQVYLQRLGEVVSYVIDEEGLLHLNLMADAGDLIFLPAPGLSIAPQDITLDTQGLATSYQPVLVPATPYDESQPPGPMGLPQHIEILFGVTDPADRQPGSPIMYLIPVNAYRAMWEQAGNQAVTDAIAQMEQLSYFVPAEIPTAGVPALPSEEIAGSNDLAVQPGRPVSQIELNETSATQTGYRFVGRWVQGPNPVTNEGLNYVYQGFTNDGKYLVSFFYPVSSSALPAAAADVSEEEMARADDDTEAYLQEKVAELNGLTPSDWEPDLGALDALVGSLEIERMPVAGIQDVRWAWTGTADAETFTVEPVENPERYQVTYGADGSVEVIADCNRAALSYELLQGGMAGGLLVQAGPMTLAECGPDSLSVEFIGNLMAGQYYRVKAGGLRMELSLPGGEGILIFHDADSPAIIQPPPPEAGVPTATVIAPAGVNVRTGPGVTYPILGVAPYGTMGEVVGVSEDGTWWAVSVPAAPDGRGWVSDSYVTVENAGDVPVIGVDPAPTATPAPTPLPTSTPVAGPAISFSASRTTINAGETATLNWQVEGVQAVYVYPVGDRFDRYPVEGTGSRDVQPGVTTTYELLAVGTDGASYPNRVEITVAGGLTTGTWVLQNYSTPQGGQQAVLPGSQITAQFAPNGALSGSAGCNQYNGGFRAFDRTLQMGGPLAVGNAFCDGLMDQEATYINLMQQAATFDITTGQLTVFDAAGNRLLLFTSS